LILKPDIMKANKFHLFGFLLMFFNLLGEYAFAGTGGARDGQLVLMILLGSLLLILGILYSVPILIHRIRDLWRKLHGC
jgi:hypothetical protein